MLASSSTRQTKNDTCARCERLLIQAFWPNGPQDAHGHSLSPLTVCYAAVSAASVLRDFNPMSCLSAGADTSAKCRQGAAPSVHLQITCQHNNTFHVVEVPSSQDEMRVFTVYVCFWTREAERGCESVCVFPDVSERVERSDGCWGQERLGGVKGCGMNV